MNRQERRRHLAMQAKKPLPPARADGRPLYMDIGGQDHVECYQCLKNGLTDIRYRGKEAVMNDPANSPAGDKDIYTICIHHLPEDAVIYDPSTNLCRNKSGDTTWMEDSPDPDASFEG